MIDFHCHILPGIDHGSSSLSTSLKQLEILREDSTVLLTHIAPSLHKPHDEIQESVLADGITVAYDGMTVEF